MASVSAADTWREAGARSDRSTGAPGGRPVPGDRPARPPLPPLPPLPSHGRSGGPVQRPPVQRSDAQGRPVQGPPVQGRPGPRPSVPAVARSVSPRDAGDHGRGTPGYPRPSAGLAPEAGRRSRPGPDDVGLGGAQQGAPGSRGSAETAVPEHGSRLRGSVAVLGVLVVTLIAGFLDATSGLDLGLITLVGIVGSSALATLLVRRRDLSTTVIAPPLVYLAVVGVLQFAHRQPDDGLRQVVAKVAAELALGQGFTVMAAATGTALVLALVRWAARR